MTAPKPSVVLGPAIVACFKCGARAPLDAETWAYVRPNSDMRWNVGPEAEGALRRLCQPCHHEVIALDAATGEEAVP